PAKTDSFDPRKRIAIIKYASIAAFETGAAGCLEHLESVGYTKDAGTVVDIFNAEGDQATLAQICAQVASAPEPYDCVVGLGTAATQAYLRANKRGAPQVMGFVASPPAINVPLGPFVEGSGRPAFLSGFGAAQPIRDLFKTLLALDPAAKRIGVAYNPGEPNSEASVKVARAACAEFGLELVEANGANVTEIVNAADVVLSRGVDAYWMPPDTVVSSAAQTLISRATQRGVPAITNFPEMAEKGAAICLGADWIACGMTTGIFAELALAGVDARSLPIDNFTPARLTLCMHAWPARWKAPEGFTESASEVWYSGREPVRRAMDLPMAPAPVLEAREALKARRAGARASVANTPAATPTIALLTFNRTPNFEDCYAGFLDEWKRLGFEDGRNCRMTLRDAQFDSGTLNTMAAAIAEERPDLVITFTTPALQAAMRRMKDRTILFSLSSSGVAAGAGRTASDHLPNITGAEVGADWQRMIEVLRATMPNARRVGTIYSPAETNSVYFEKEWRAALAAAGIELVSTAADKATELPEAADALVTAPIDAVVQISDNLTSTGFRSIVRAADRAKLPVFAFAPIGVRHGATVMVTRDYHDVGRLTANLAKRLLAGESAAGIPFSAPERTVFAVNPARLERFGLAMPEALRAQAEVQNEESAAASAPTNPAAPGAPR
ncbi:MAG: ABC transporter substrate-binding protein, partial [Planctomycetaceae bacterium]|nr:ABC transporter substrate-binding protein [Planctomycetaceae bacterium]